MYGTLKEHYQRAKRGKKDQSIESHIRKNSGTKTNKEYRAS